MSILTDYINELNAHIKECSVPYNEEEKSSPTEIVSPSFSSISGLDGKFPESEVWAARGTFSLECSSDKAPT